MTATVHPLSSHVIAHIITLLSPFPPPSLLPNLPPSYVPLPLPFSYMYLPPSLPGTNDDENFPESFLFGIYERILQKEFETGKDHTHQVLEIRKKLFGHKIPVSNITTPTTHYSHTHYHTAQA